VVTQALNEAWAVLQNPESKAKYDESWREEQFAALPTEEKVHAYRQEGNHLFRAAREMSANGLATTAECNQKYHAAINKYNAGIALAPENFYLWSNRAACFAKLENWRFCRDDSLQVTQLAPEFLKGWLMLVKALCKMGQQEAAQVKLDVALNANPDNKDFMDLAVEFGLSAARPSQSEEIFDQSGVSEPICASVPDYDLEVSSKSEPIVKFESEGRCRVRPQSASGRISSFLASALGSVSRTGSRFRMASPAHIFSSASTVEDITRARAYQDHANSEVSTQCSSRRSSSTGSTRRASPANSYVFTPSSTPGNSARSNMLGQQTPQDCRSREASTQPSSRKSSKNPMQTTFTATSSSQASSPSAWLKATPAGVKVVGDARQFLSSTRVANSGVAADAPQRGRTIPGQRLERETGFSQNGGSMKHNISLSSLAASSRLGLGAASKCDKAPRRPMSAPSGRARPASAPSCRARPGSASQHHTAWS
jgi:tetratricopeptide (TPR) repeat protein